MALLTENLLMQEFVLNRFSRDKILAQKLIIYLVKLN